MNRPYTIWFLELGTGWRRLLTPQRSLDRATKCAQGLLVRRPDIDRVEVREGEAVRYRTDRTDWQGWL